MGRCGRGGSATAPHWHGTGPRKQRGQQHLEVPGPVEDEAGGGAGQLLHRHAVLVELLDLNSGELGGGGGGGSVSDKRAAPEPHGGVVIPYLCGWEGGFRTHGGGMGYLEGFLGVLSCSVLLDVQLQPEGGTAGAQHHRMRKALAPVTPQGISSSAGLLYSFR